MIHRMAKPLKILIITNLFPNNKEPNRGIFIKQEALELSKLCEIQVIAPIPWVPFSLRFLPQWSTNAQIKDQEIIENITTYHPRWLVIPKILRSLYGLLLFFSLLRTVRKIKRSFNFGIIYGHWIYPDGFACVLLARIFKVPVILHALGCDINQYSKFFLRKIQIAWSLKNADKIISVSNALKEKMCSLGTFEKKIHVIANGVDSCLFKPMAKQECRKLLGLPQNLKIILFIGSLEIVKGAEYLIDAFQKVNSEYGLPVNLVLIGKGPSEKTIREKIAFYKQKSSVTLAGEINHNKIPLWMNAADVFCLPSIREGMPNVILEALSCGKPVVASSVGGIPELVTSSDYGILFPPGDSSILAKSLLTALRRDYDEDKIAKHFSSRTWKTIAEEIYFLLKRKHGVNAVHRN